MNENDAAQCASIHLLVKHYDQIIEAKNEEIRKQQRELLHLRHVVSVFENHHEGRQSA